MISFKNKILLVIVPLLFVLDQITKWLVIKYIPLQGHIEVIPGFFDIVHFKNSGAAFGMFAESASWFRQPFFYIIAVVVTIFLIVFFVQLAKESRLLPVAISLVLAGIAGNILDRIRLGAVTDFLSVHIRDHEILGIPLDWPAFNVADSAITVAMFLFIISAFKSERGK